MIEHQKSVADHLSRRKKQVEEGSRLSDLHLPHQSLLRSPRLRRQRQVRLEGPRLHPHPLNHRPLKRNLVRLRNLPGEPPLKRYPGGVGRGGDGLPRLTWTRGSVNEWSVNQLPCHLIGKSNVVCSRFQDSTNEIKDSGHKIKRVG